MGIPVVGEYFPTDHANMSPEQLHENVLMGSRIVAELGADAIKTFHTRDFRAVTSTCPRARVRPGGGEAADPAGRTACWPQREVEEGAGGVVFGRNAIQVPDPFAFQAALCDVVKRGRSAADACREHQLED